MTSTISPNQGIHALLHSDPLIRLNEYCRALDFNLSLLRSNLIDMLVFVDNSGYDLSTLKALVARSQLSDRVEFVSYVSDVSPNNNRLYLEAHLIENFFLQSQTFREYRYRYQDNFLVWKVTGRYIILNIKEIILSCLTAGSFDMYLNFRNYPYPVLDFYILGFRPSTYDKIVSRNIELLSGTRDGEIVLREVVSELMDRDSSILFRFPEVPKLRGIRGFDGAKYGGIKDSFKYFLRYVSNLLFPRFWI
jgi:hypothetical protein